MNVELRVKEERELGLQRSGRTEQSWVEMRETTEPWGVCDKLLLVFLLELQVFYRVEENKKDEGERVLGVKNNIQLTKREGYFLMHPVIKEKMCF